MSVERYSAVLPVSAEAVEDAWTWDEILEHLSRPYVPPPPPTRWDVIRSRVSHAWAALRGESCGDDE